MRIMNKTKKIETEKNGEKSSEIDEGDLIAKVDYPISMIPKPSQKPTYCLLSFNIGNMAAPGINVKTPWAEEFGGPKETLRYYKVLKAFKNREEAEKYSNEHKIPIQ